MRVYDCRRAANAGIKSGLACACLILTLSSCSNKSVSPSEYAERYDYKINMIYTEYAGKGHDGETAANFKWFCDKFNIGFEFLPMTWANWTEKTRVWTYSGNMPDIIFLDIAPARFAEYAEAARQGAYKALPDFGDKYPNLQKYKDELKSIKHLSIDGVLYTLPKSRDGADWNDAGFWGYIYRRDWAEQLGLAKDNDIYTIDEWIGLLKAFITLDPNGNGEGNTAGIGGRSWCLPKYMGGEVINPYFLTFPKIDGKYVWGPAMPESIELVKTFKRMYDQGIIWRGMFDGRDAGATNLYCAGLMGATPNNMTVVSLDGFRHDFSLVNPDVTDVKKATALAIISSNDGVINTAQTEDFWSSFSFNPNVDNDKLERILTAFDWLASKDGLNFMSYGIQGVDWDYEGDEVAIKWEQNQDGTYAYPYPANGEHWMPLVLKDAFNLKSPSFPKALQTEILNYQQLRLSVGNLIPFDYDAVYSQGAEFAKTGTMENEILEKFWELLQTSEDIELDWKNWLDEMQPRYKPVENELNGVVN